MENSARNRRRGSDSQAKPIQLLQQIGLMGKEVVGILKGRGWEVCDPKALQENKLYYVPGGRAKGELVMQGEDFFVGEGELYSYILERGGIRFLLPDEEWSTETKMETDSDVEFLEQPPSLIGSVPQNLEAVAVKVAVAREQSASFEAPEKSGDLQTDLSTTTSENSGPQQPKRKRHKKLSITEGKVAAKLKPAKGQVQKPLKKSVGAGNGLTTASLAEGQCHVKREPIPFVSANGCGRLVDFSAYEAALSSRGWRAQLLQDVDLHLLRSVAAISRRQLVLEATGGKHKVFSGPSQTIGPHESDETGMLQELVALSSGIKASQNDISSMVAGIIAQAEQFHTQDRVECAARVGISRFVSTGSGNLMLMRDIERHMLLIVAAVRQYLRARNVTSSGERDSSAHTADKRSDLRALQLNIEKMNAELDELSTIVSAQAKHLSRKDTSATPMQLDADVETDSEQWFV